MSTARESFRNDLHRDPGELESEADRAREHLEHTLEALERRFSPGEILDQVLRTVKGNGSEFGHNLAVQVRNNPVPVLLTGVGIAWLLSASNRPPSAAEAGGPGMMERASSAASSARGAAGSTASSARGAASRAGEATQSMGATVRDKAAGAREGATHAAQRTAEATHRAAAGTVEAARQMSAATRSGAERMYYGYDYLRREQPLVLGALAIAAGALIGSLLPSTRAEDRAMGEYRDRTLDELGDEAKRRAREAGEVAADAAESAASAARDTVKSSTEADRKGPASAGPSTSGANTSGGSASTPTSGAGSKRSPGSSDANPGLP